MRSSISRRWRWLAIVAVLAIVAAACGGGGGDEGTETTQGTSATTEATTATTEGGGEETPGFTLRYAIFNDLTTDNYWAYLDTESEVWNSYVIGGQALSLYGLSAPNYTLVPVAAADAEPPKGADAGDGTWVIDVPMRQGLTWSDGSPVTANDVAFTINTVKDLGMGGNWLGSYSFDDPEDDSDVGIISVEAVDDYTVRFVWSGQPGLALWQFGAAQGAFLSEAYWGEKAAAAADAATLEAESGEGAPSGGAFVYAGREPGAFARNVANENFWDAGSTYVHYQNGAVKYTNPNLGIDEVYGGEATGDVRAEYTEGPFADEVIYSIYGTQDAAVLALKDGEVDYMLNPLGLQRGLQGIVLEAPDLEIISNQSLGFRYLSFNVRKFPMSDTAFRQAIACMIDKEFMANNVLQGVAIPMDSVIPAGASFWANPDVEAWCAGLSQAERVEEAKRILKEAGWTWTVEPEWNEDNRDVIPKGEGLRGPNGETLPDSLELLAPGPGYDPLRATYSLFIEDWANDLGIPIQAEPTGFSVIVDKVFGPVDWDMYILGWGIGIFPDHIVEFFECSRDSAQGGFNTPGYCNPEFDALAKQFEETTDLNEAQRLVKEMDAIIARDVPYVVLFTTPILEAYRNTLQFPFTDVLDGLQNLGGAPDIVKVAS